MLLAQACQEHFLIGPFLRTALPLDEEEVLAFADRMQARSQIVVAVGSQPPQFTDQLIPESLESLDPATRLSLEPEGTVIRLQAFVPPQDSPTREALFIFPRPTRPLAPAATLRFVTEFGFVGGKKVQLDARFKVRQLLFEGKPEY